MARGPTPAITIRIVDEVSEKLDRKRREMIAHDKRVHFRQTAQQVSLLESGLHRLNRELMSFIGLTGITGFVSGGLVLGIAKVAESLKNFSDQSLKLQYLSKETELTTQQLSKLISAGKVLGMGQEEARGSVVSLQKAFEQLRTEGTNAAIFKRLSQATGGEELARKLIRLTRGPDGIYRAMQYLSEQTLKMNERGQNFIKDVFNQPSVAWAEMLGMKGLIDVQEPQRKELIAYNLAWENLNRTWYNTKVTLNQALMPAMQSVLDATSEFVRGPGRELVNRFAAWLSTITAADINAFVKGIEGGLKWFAQGLEKLLPILEAIDKFVRENLGGWKNVLIGVGSFAILVWLGSFARSLAALGPLIAVVSAVAGVAALVAPTSAAAAPEGGAPGGGTGGGQPGGGTSGEQPGGTGPTQLPEVEVTPDDNVPLPRARPGRRGSTTNQKRSDVYDPETAAPYQVAGLDWQPPPKTSDMRQDRESTQDLARKVIKTTEKIAALNNYLSSEIGDSSDAGAGKIAALATRMSTGGGGYNARGGGYSGGGGRYPSGGTRSGGDGRGPSTGPTTTGDKETLPKYATVRLNNPGAATAPAGTVHRKMAETYGSTGGQHLPGGGYTPAFPTPVHGAAFNMWFLSNKKWIGRKVSDIIWEWSGHSRRWATGFNGNEILTEEALKDPAFMIKLAKGIAAGEAPGRYPMDQAQWEQAFRWYQNGSVPIDPATGKPEVPLKRADKGPEYQPRPGGPNVPPVTSSTEPIKTTGGPELGNLPSPITGELWQGPGAPRDGGRRRHAGFDIGAPEGTPIYSMGPGTVLRSGNQGGITGGIVVVRYDNGIEAKYMHLSDWDVWRLTNGGKTRIDAAGQVIALSGRTGAKGISPHLHVEYRDKNGRLLNAADVHGFGPMRGYESLRGRKVISGQPGSYKPGETTPPPGASQGNTNTNFLWPKLTPDDNAPISKPRTRFPISINIRGSRAARVGASTSQGVIDMKVNREYDATGGGRIESPA